MKSQSIADNSRGALCARLNFRKHVERARNQGSVFFSSKESSRIHLEVKRGNGMCNWGKVGQIAVVRRVAVRAGQMDTIPSKGCHEREREREGSRDKENFISYIFVSRKNTIHAYYFYFD